MLLEVVSWRVFWSLTTGCKLKLRNDMTVQNLHHKTDLRVSPSPAWQTFASHQGIYNSKDWKGGSGRGGGDAAVFLILVQLQRGEVELFFTNSGMGHSLAREMVAWSSGCTCQDMQRYFCSFSRVWFLFVVFLQAFALACAPFHFCTKFYTKCSISSIL